MNPLALALAAAATLAMPSSARDRDEVPPARLTGPPRDCVGIRDLGSSHVRNDRVIDFLRTGRRGYRVTLDRGCPGLGFDRAFSYRTSLTQLCRQDIITVRRQVGAGLDPGASCGLAPFQPIELIDPRAGRR